MNELEAVAAAVIELGPAAAALLVALDNRRRIQRLAERLRV